MSDPEVLVSYWSMSFRYQDWNLAGKAYEQSRDLIFGGDVNASAYRILLNARPFVVIVGPGQPLLTVVDQLHTICHHGESTDVPDDVILTLALRHEQFRTPEGTKFERRGFS